MFALVSGAIFRAPELKTAKSGRAFCAATIRTKDGDFIKLLVFSESASAELMRLHAGDAVSAQGGLKIELYDGKDGDKRVGLTIMADAVLPLRRAPKAKKPGEEEPSRSPPDRSRLDRYGGDGVDHFGDEVPF